MKLSHDQVTLRITNYMTERLMPMAKSPVNKFKIGFALPIVPQMVAYYWRTGEDLGIVDAQGLDTERLSVCMESGMKQVESLDIQGFKFNNDDVRDFIRYLNS